MIKAVVFDMGGVLVSDVWENLFFNKKNGMAAMYNMNTDIVQKAGAELWEKYAHITDVDWKELEAKYWAEFMVKTGMNIPMQEIVTLTNGASEPMIGAQQFLEKLSNTKINMGICSNNTEFFFNRQAQKIDLYKYFLAKNISLSCRIGKSKLSPHFEMFKFITKTLGVQKEECLFIDDRVEMVSHSLKYGFISILYPSHSGHNDGYLEKLFQKLGIF